MTPAVADPAGTVAIRSEVATAWGRLWAEAPRLAARLQNLTGYSQILLGFLRAVDHYRETYDVSDIEIDTWRTGDELRHRLTSQRHNSTPGMARVVDGEWFLRRTNRLAHVIALPGIIAEFHNITRLLDGYCEEHGCEPVDIAEAAGHPIFARGLTYVVHKLEIP